MSGSTPALPPFNCLDAGRDRHCLHYEEGDGDCCTCGKVPPPSCEECGGFKTADPEFDDNTCRCAAPVSLHRRALSVQ